MTKSYEIFDDFYNKITEEIRKNIEKKYWEDKKFYEDFSEKYKQLEIKYRNLEKIEKERDEYRKTLEECEKFLRNLWVESEEMFVEYEWYVWVQFKNWDEYLQIVY